MFNARCPNGNHVIKYCLQTMTPADNDFIYQVGLGPQPQRPMENPCCSCKGPAAPARPTAARHGLQLQPLRRVPAAAVS